MPTEPDPHLFVYGSLLSTGAARHVIAEFEDPGRGREPASVPGLLIEGDDYVIATFDQSATTRVTGELVYLRPDRQSQWEAFRRLDRLENDFYERISVRPRLERTGREVSARAYAWRRRESFEQLLDSAGRKYEIAEYHREALAGLPHVLNFERTAVTIPAQAHFEGVLGAAFSMGEQLVKALSVACELGRVQRRRDDRRPEWMLIFDQLHPHEEAIPEVSRLREWLSASLVEDARLVRNKAIHASYDKTGVWSKQIDAAIVQPIRESSYTGDRELRAYVDALVSQMEALAELIEPLREREADLHRLSNRQPGQ